MSWNRQHRMQRQAEAAAKKAHGHHLSDEEYAELHMKNEHEQRERERNHQHAEPDDDYFPGME